MLSGRIRSSLALAGALALALPLAACGTDDGAAASDGDGTLAVLASFYPLQFVTERVGGDAVTVTSLTPQGAEPHDLELSPAQVAAMSEADLVVFLSGFQPAVDDAVAQTSPRAVDVAGAVHLEAGEEGHDHADGEEHAEDDHAEEEHSDEDHAEDEGDEHDHGGLDPHFWLDPLRLADAADEVAAALADAAPEHAADFEANAAELRADLVELDESFHTGLAQCSSRVIVTSHEAFGYLAEAYDLRQVGISGIDPEAEPSPARLREISEIVEAEGVTTIFTESLVNPRVAEVLADDLGITTAVLDPIESITDTSPGEDYFAVMTANLEALRTALDCA